MEKWSLKAISSQICHTRHSLRAHPRAFLTVCAETCRTDFVERHLANSENGIFSRGLRRTYVLWMDDKIVKGLREDRSGEYNEIFCRSRGFI